MKTFVKNLLLLGALACTLGCCKKEANPPTPNPLKTEEDAWNALNDCYEGMRGPNTRDEMCTDNARAEGSSERVQQNTVSADTPYRDYDFNAVNKANAFLARIDQCPISDDLKTRMKAEARFLRAFAFLELTRYFGKVALTTKEIAGDAPDMARNSLEEVHAFILRELSDAAFLLPESYAGGYLNETTRVTRYGAWALRARAALYFGDYAEAEKSALEVMDSRKYDLFRIASTDASHTQESDEMDLYVDFDALGINKQRYMEGMFSYEALWHGAHATPANKEYVLSCKYEPDADRYPSCEPMQDLVDAYWSIDGKSTPFLPTVEQRKADYQAIWTRARELDKDAYKQFATDDNMRNDDFMREFRNRDSRFYASILFPFKGWHGSPAGEHYYRWDPAGGNSSRTGFGFRKMAPLYMSDKTASPTCYPVIRYAEVLLTFAEAHVMNTGYDRAVQDALNDIRERCGMPYVPASLSKDAAVAFIRNERRIELAGEGHRFDDVRRYGADYCRQHLNGHATAPDGSVVAEKVWNDRLLLMPIPTTTLDAVPQLKGDQNPGY